MTPFEEELYRLLQDAKREATAFTSSEEDAGNDTHKIIKFSQKWNFKQKYNQILEEKDALEKKYLKEQTQLTDNVSRTLIKELIPIIDEINILANFAKEGSPIERGIKLTLSKLEKILTRRQGGVVRPVIGDELDPRKHKAISAEQVSGHYGNTISEVYRHGYFLFNQIVREAEVKVKCGIKT